MIENRENVYIRDKNNKVIGLMEDAFKVPDSGYLPELSPKQEFEKNNNFWIRFLNEFSKKEFHGLTEELKALHNIEICLNYQTEKELAKAIYDFLISNLKAIIRGGNKIEYGNLRNDLRFFINSRSIIHIDDQGNYYPDIISYSEDSIIPRLPIIIDSWFLYIRSLLKGTNKFFISICPYQRRQAKECGLIFVARGKNVEACKEHAKHWGYMKYNRKLRKAKNLI